MLQKYLGFLPKIKQFFSRQSNDERSLMDKLRDKYRLVIMNDDTFEEVTSLRLTPLSVYVFLSSLIVGTAFLVTFLIIWTPIKRYIPGYGDFKRDAEIAALTTKLTNLEEEVDAHRRYNENFRKLLVGDMSGNTKADALKQGIPENPADTLPQDVERIPEDDQLRSAVAQGNFTSDPALAATVASGNRTGPTSPRDLPLEQMHFIPPVSGEITSPFDRKKEHFGVDVAAPKNTAIKAAADGMVINAGYTVETGYIIAIQHPNNVVTMYKHNSILLKKEGSPVKAGEAVAIIGNTGEQSSGPHLHFELWHKGRAVDPVGYVNFR
jgi:murein DD-endopeptidase MepM/ murein hydrolase activator NlpD